MEEYRDIQNFPNYEVSNLGNVRNKKRGNVLKPLERPKKYKYISYTVNIANDIGLQKHKYIHRLVAEAFIPNPENKKEIDHIDRNPANNVVENLQWVNRAENMINVSLRSDNKSGHRGIRFCNQKWQITYQFEKKKYHGGFYNTYEEAVANYKDPSNLKSGEILDYSKPITTQTGQKYITFHRKLFEFGIIRNKVRHRKSFETLEDAILYRDQYLISLSKE